MYGAKSLPPEVEQEPEQAGVVTLTAALCGDVPVESFAETVKLYLVEAERP
jgi:hypothetical protein